MKVHPTFGNLVVEEGETAVSLRLSYDPSGGQRATFTYREIALLAERLAMIRDPRRKAALELDDDDLALLG